MKYNYYYIISFFEIAVIFGVAWRDRHLRTVLPFEIDAENPNIRWNGIQCANIGPEQGHFGEAGDDENFALRGEINMVDTEFIAYFKIHQCNNCLATVSGHLQYLASSYLINVAIHPAFYNPDYIGSSHHFGANGSIQTSPIPSTVTTPS